MKNLDLQGGMVKSSKFSVTIACKSNAKLVLSRKASRKPVLLYLVLTFLYVSSLDFFLSAYMDILNDRFAKEWSLSAFTVFKKFDFYIEFFIFLRQLYIKLDPNKII